MTTAEQFKTMCDMAVKERNDRSSAVNSCVVAEKTLRVSGWNFGVSDLRKAADDILNGWVSDTSIFLGATETVYAKDGFSVILSGYRM